MTISIVIPVYNEETTISKTIAYLVKTLNPKFTKEIIIIDGGSTDKTLEVLKSYPSIIVLQSEKGRSKQMNLGARNATSEVLYFLHCDTFPPQNFDTEIIRKIQDNHLSGCFKMRFDNQHIVLKVSQWFTQFNHISCRGGDQSLFVEKMLFEKLNGFNESLTIYEDNEFISRLYKNSKFTVIQKTVTTSARKYIKNGVWKLQFHFMMIHIKNSFGTSQKQLLKYYQKNIK